MLPTAGGGGTIAVASIAPLEPIKRLVLDAVRSPHSRRAYAKALDDFLVWHRREPRQALSRALVQRYRVVLEQAGLAPATINVRLAAVKKLASEAAENGLLAADQAAAIARVKGVRRLGVRAGNWLTLEQARALLDSPDAGTTKGLRDRAMLALLIGCGLRRSEVAALEVDRVVERDGRWVIADLEGKGNRVRTVAVPSWVKARIDDWTAVASVRSGFLFRPLTKGGRVTGDRMSEKVVWWVALEHARDAGLGRVSPHDLRRTCAKLCRAAGGDLEQIQFLLGHASIQTTERYLGGKQDLTRAVNDGIRL